MMDTIMKEKEETKKEFEELKTKQEAKDAQMVKMQQMMEQMQKQMDELTEELHTESIVRGHFEELAEEKEAEDKKERL